MYPPVKMKLGELLVSLTYLPAKNTLTIGVLKARNLKAKDINGKSGKSAVFYCIAGPMEATEYWVCTQVPNSKFFWNKHGLY